MNEILTISKKALPLQSMDFAFLRQQAIEYIQKYASGQWTDHNAHDPGITILEALCYAITELGGKINMPIQDLIASQKGLTLSDFNDVFQSSSTCLPNSALTATDYRRLLIDIDGVKDAFFVKSEDQEVALFYDSFTNEVSFNLTSTPILLNGLFKTQIEFSDWNGIDLNSNIFEDSTPLTVGSDNYRLSYAIPPWDSLDEAWFTNPTINAATINFADVTPIGAGPFTNYSALVDIGLDGFPLIIDFPIQIFVEPEVTADIRINLAARLQDIITPGNLYEQVLARNFEINSILKRLRKKIYAYRNIGEDFIQFEALQVQEIAINGAVEIDTNENPNKTLALIYFIIQQFLNPPILSQRYDTISATEALPIEAIYEGPLLENGFIAESILQSNTRNNIIYVSDFIRLINNLKEVSSLRNLNISSFIDNRLVVVNEINCFTLRDEGEFKPKLSITKSNLAITKNGIVQSIDDELVISFLDQLIAAAATTVEQPLQNKPPQGVALAIDDYYSVQYDLPAVYGVGEHKLSSSNSIKRKALAKQLQGFLLVFDQILANYSSQISNLFRFFSLDETLEETYFSQPLYSIPGVEQLLLSFDQSNLSWSNFIADPQNRYIQNLTAVLEERTNFLTRRNKTMDHLLARFGEEFPSYSSLLYKDLNTFYFKEKINFYKNYNQYSTYRSKAFDYTQEAWDTDNISGFQKRICALLGMPDCTRRNLSTSPDVNNYFSFNLVSGLFELQFLAGDTDIVINSLQSVLVNAQNTAIEIIRHGVEPSRFGNTLFNSNRITIDLQDDTGTVIAEISSPVPAYSDELFARNSFIDHFRNLLLQIHKDGEGIYMIEHLLLRPKDNLAEPLSTTLSITPPRTINDPYTFQVSIILPSGYSRDFSNPATPAQRRIWSYRFQNLNFRNFIEQKIQEELPAHLLPRIYWLDVNTAANQPEDASLDNFETAYQNWLNEVANPTSTQATINIVQNALVEILNELFTTYEDATSA